MLRFYVRLWIVFILILAYEAYMLNTTPQLSLTAFLKEAFPMQPTLQSIALTPEPGKTISLFWGWTGMGLMLLTNLYVLRKRLSFMSSWGNMPNWLNFHIFCGLLGPTFILFHTNFKIGGLVAISFWSMVIVFASGVVGRYFYVQIAQQKTELEKTLQITSNEMKMFLSSVGVKIEEKVFEDMKAQAIRFAGLTQPVEAHAALGEGHQMSVSAALWHSIIGDLFLRWRIKKLTHPLPRVARHHFRRSLRYYARVARRVGTLEGFRQIMGYWHSFHMPFAFFMYGIAAIHIAVALLFQVKA